MLNKSGKNGHPCCIPDFKGKALRFSLLKIILAVGFYDIEVCSFYPYTVESFNQEKMLHYMSNASSASMERIVWFLSLLLMRCITLINL